MGKSSAAAGDIADADFLPSLLRIVPQPHLEDNLVDGQNRPICGASGRHSRAERHKSIAGRQVTPMKHAPSLDNIRVLLHRALPEFLALPGIREQVRDIPLSGVHLARSVKNVVEIRNEWLAAVPEFKDVHDWVQVHWDPERQTHPPGATVATSDKWGHAGETQLDALAATCKLILAAAGYGTETVARCAIEFSGHGMIEVRTFYLLKGLPVLNARSLDDYCNLLPYPEALQKMTEASLEELLAEDRSWPPESADNVVRA